MTSWHGRARALATRSAGIGRWIRGSVRAGCGRRLVAGCSVLLALAQPVSSNAGQPGQPAISPTVPTAPIQPARFAAPADVTVPIDPIRLTARSWYVQGDLGMISLRNQGFNSNAGFVVTDEGVVVFDTLGTPALGTALLARIRSITDKPIRYVVISHFHSDHFYGAQAFKAAGAEIWAHRLGREYLATDAPRARLEERRQSLGPWVTDAARIVPADRWIDEETTFRLGGLTFRLMPAGPAHTPEDLMMLVEEEGVLFAGDLMFAGRIPFVGSADSKGWLAALDRLIVRAPRIIVGGHGAASTDAAADLALTRDYLTSLREQMGRGVEDLLSFDEAFDRSDWSRFASLPAFDAAHRRNAYNTFILMEREALGGR
jgi:glyoxylase-like metal-dependent hydrolase (beta-lactamase superfamily II)